MYGISYIHAKTMIMWSGDGYGVMIMGVIVYIIPRGMRPLGAQWMTLIFSEPLVSSFSFGRDKNQPLGQ